MLGERVRGAVAGDLTDTGEAGPPEPGRHRCLGGLGKDDLK